LLVLDGKTDLNQISLTGVRAITLIGLLAVAPRSLEEIRQAFIDLKIMDESHSNDILRIDLNTIKSFGCEISRPCAKTGYKYVLTKHPFTIPVTLEDVKVLKRLFNNMKSSIDITRLFKFNQLLNKIAKYIYEDEIREEFYGLSPLKHYNSEIVNTLINVCEEENTITIMYQKATAKYPKQQEIIAKKLVYKSNKLYLYGYDLNKKVYVTLLVSRIVSIDSKKITNEKCKNNTFNVNFELKDFDADFLTDEEIVIGNNKNSILVEGQYFNEFLAIQRILYFGPKCTVTKPMEFRDKIISKLKEMRKLYEK